MVVMPRDRSPDDWRVVNSRVEVYRQQVEQYGHIMWLPNIVDPPRGGGSNETQEEQDD